MVFYFPFHNLLPTESKLLPFSLHFGNYWLFFLWENATQEALGDCCDKKSAAKLTHESTLQESTQQCCEHLKLLQSYATCCRSPQSLLR